jgi:type IV secretion system protein VirD4
MSDENIRENTLTTVYKIIANGNVKYIDALFENVDEESAAKLSYNIFASGSDTIKASVITGLGTRLQSFQNEMVQKITSNNNIDLELPAKQKCAYFLILSDMERNLQFPCITLFYVLF